MRNSRLRSIVLAAAVGLVATAAPAPFPGRTEIDGCDVTWTTPSTNSTGSMPLGNGDIGLNAWVEADGDLMLLLSKSDAWSENAQLLKLGRLRLQLRPNPFRAGAPFTQQLRLADGEILVRAGSPPESIELRLRVDAHHPLVCIDLNSENPREIRVASEIWRTSRRELVGPERHAVYGLYDAPTPVFSEPDQVVDAGPERIAWLHRNPRSIWRENLELQALGPLAGTLRDPLLDRAFGVVVRGEGLRRVQPSCLESTQALRRLRLLATAHTRFAESPDAWLGAIDELDRRHAVLEEARALAAHRGWWSAFWARSWIEVTGAPDAHRVTRGYALQRYLNACAGRGAMPIKFNGSLFTMETRHQGRAVDPDFRLWGGPYWFQNTRLPYWSMLASGDHDLLEPLFRMYLESLPLARFRTRKYYGHDGAFWPETMYFWGTYVDDNYGRDRRGQPDGLTDNRYIRYYWSGGLELVLLLLDQHRHAGDDAFLRRAVLPLADDIVRFFDEHGSRDARGRIRLEPSQSLETYHVAVNPAPDIAGLRAVLPRLLKLPESATTAPQRARWRRLFAELPDLPVHERDGVRILAPAESFSEKANAENPELYAIFPYRLFGVDQPDLDLGRRSFEHRLHRGTGGWQQDAIQAARLGLADVAADMVAANFSRPNPECRFPAFWGPNFDWTPDQDHGAVAMIALQTMLLDGDRAEPRLLPAWPKRWNVRFKLHAPGRRIVEGEARDGVLVTSRIVPTANAPE